MNPTNNSCPSDIARFVTTDYRPSKALYTNVRNNNDFRAYLQHNASQIMSRNLQNHVKSMNCSCGPKNDYSTIKRFDSSKLDSIENKGSGFII